MAEVEDGRPSPRLEVGRAIEKPRMRCDGGLEIGDFDDDAVEPDQHAANIARLFRYSLSAIAGRAGAHADRPRPTGGVT